MTSTADTTEGDHPIRSVLSRIDAILEDVRDNQAPSMGPEEAAVTLTHLAQVRVELSELQLRMARHLAAVTGSNAEGEPSADR
jgi:hypothetical protein